MVLADRPGDPDGAAAVADLAPAAPVFSVDGSGAPLTR